MLDLSNTPEPKKFAGKINFIIQESYEKTSAAGNKYWGMKFVVIDTDFKGWKITEIFTHKNAIAMSNLTQLARAVGVEDMENVKVGDFINKKVTLDVGTKRDKGSDRDKNYAKEYFVLEENSEGYVQV